MLTLKMPGFADTELSVNLTSDQSVSAEMNRAMYELTIISNPTGADVIINGLQQDSPTTFSRKMRGGTYTVEVVADGYLTLTSTVVVDKNTALVADLAKPGEVRDQSDRPDKTVIAAGLASPDATSAVAAEPRKLTRKEKRALRGQEKAALGAEKEKAGEESRALEAGAGKQERSLRRTMWKVTMYSAAAVAVIVIIAILNTGDDSSADDYDYGDDGYEYE